MTIRGRLFRLSPPNLFGTEVKLADFLEDNVAPSKLVILGEYHGISSIVSLQTRMQEVMVSSLPKPFLPLPGAVVPCRMMTKLSRVGLGGRQQGQGYGYDQDQGQGGLPRVRIVMEHFSRDMQPILDGYQAGTMDFLGLMSAYREIGTEGHDLKPYIPALESARLSPHQHLHGGFIPRTYSRLLMKNGIQVALDAAKNNGYVSPDECLQGTDEHYNFFEGMLTGRDIHDGYNSCKTSEDCGKDGEDNVMDKVLPSDRFRSKMFPAQILKDASMAFTVRNLLLGLNNNINCNNTNAVGCEMGTESGTLVGRDTTTSQDKVLVIVGVGHMLYSHGVPERIISHIDGGQKEPNQSSNSNDNSSDENAITNKTLRVACLAADENSHLNPIETLKKEYGGPDLNAADFCFLYEEADGTTTDKKDYEDDDQSSIVIRPNAKCKEELTNDMIIEETREAYDRVGATAHLSGGDKTMAKSMMTSLGYTPKEFEVAAQDAVNYQGVGCPHRHVSIKPGDKVLDMGSGLGVDSMIASGAVGPSGTVLGIDLSSDCVKHANKRAKERGLDQFVSFRRASLEDLSKVVPPNDDNVGTFDHVISNGAFCLVPDKRAGFSECFRMLKSGGDIAVCTTVVKNELPDLSEDGLDFPICMQTFARMEELVPMLEALGFVDIEIDFSDSLMEVEEEEELDDEEEPDNMAEEESDESGEEEDSEGRFKVHNEEGRESFRHLENFDMNTLCARVVVKAKKP